MELELTTFGWGYKGVVPKGLEVKLCAIGNLTSLTNRLWVGRLLSPDTGKRSGDLCLRASLNKLFDCCTYLGQEVGRPLSQEEHLAINLETLA